MCSIVTDVYFLTRLVFRWELMESHSDHVKLQYRPASFCKDATPKGKIYYIIRF